MSRFKNPGTLIVVLLLPVLVAAIGLWALAGRVDRVDNVPAAVVNLDEGAEMEVDGKTQTVPFGRMLAGGLTQPDTAAQSENSDGEVQETGFDWQLTDEDSATEGLRSGRYAAVVVIPKDFSKNVASIGTTDAARAQIDVTTNDASGMMNSLVGQAVAQAAAANMGTTLTEQYLSQIYVGFDDLKDGFQDAADGASELSDGNAQLADGTKELADGTGELADGSEQLADGNEQLSVGLDQLAGGAQGVADGNHELADGSHQLANGAQGLADGNRELADGSRQLAGGAQQAADGMDRYASGMEQLRNGADGVAQGNRELASGMDQLAAGSGELASGVSALQDGLHGTSQQQGLLEGSAALAAGATGDGTPDNPGLVAGSEQLASGAEELAAGAHTNADGVRTAADQLDGTQIRDGADQLSGSGDGVVQGAEGVRDGVKQLDESLTSPSPASPSGASPVEIAQQVAGQCQSGDPTVTPEACALATQVLTTQGYLQGADGNTGLVDGSTQLASGAQEYVNGVDEFTNGATSYADGVDLAFQGDGTAKNPGLVAGAEGVADGADRVAAGARASADQAPQLVDGIVALDDGLQQFSAGVDELAGGATQLDDGVQRSADGANELAAGSDRLAEGTQQSVDGANQLSTGTRELADGAQQGADGADRLADGSAELADGAQRGAEGADQLADGSDQLADGTRASADGADELATGARAGADGASQLAEGADELKDGAAEAADGSSELADGLQEGVDEVPSYSEAEKDRMAQMGSEPITVASQRDNEVNGGATATMPFAVALALWLGAFATFLVLPALSQRFLDAALPMPLVVLRSLLPALIIGVAQAVLALVGVAIFGVEPVSWLSIITIALSGALMFAAFHQAVLALLGGMAGRVVSMLLAAVQVVVLAGILPLETAPPVLQAISGVLPLTIVNQGMVHASMGGSVVTTSGTLGMIAVWGVVSIVVSMIAARSARMLHPGSPVAKGHQPVPAAA